MKTLAGFILVLLMFNSFSCKKNQIIDSTDLNLNGKILLKIDKENAPENIVEITAYLTRDEFDTKIGNLNLISDNSADILLENIAVGLWNLRVEAKDSTGLILYDGESEVNVLEGITIQVNLTLQPTGNGFGNIYLFVTWGQKHQEIVFNFDNDSNLYEWVGPAYREVINGELNLWSQQGYAWRYLVDDPTYFSKGELDVDIYMEEEAYLSIEAKGHLIESNDINWGIHTQFNRDSVFNVVLVDSKPIQFFAGYLYQGNEWYHVKIKFDCNEGSKGNYELWIKPKFSNEEPTYLGKFNFRNGKIIGINHFGFGVGDVGLNEIKHAKVDNIRFKF